MPYCIYLRKSRADIEAEKSGDGDVLARHRRTLQELARRSGYDIGEIYHEIVSGDTIAERPEMRRLLGDAQTGMWDGVLVMEVERLARGDTMDQGLVAQTFKYTGTLIVTPIKVYDPNDEFDEEYFEFSLFMSRREYKAIRRRQEAGKLAACKEGRWIWNVTPYGYMRVRNDDGKGWRLVPDPQEADILRNIFSWYVDGDLQPDGSMRRLGVSLICRKLNELSVPTRVGNHAWITATVRDILKNPVYIGKIRVGQRRTVKKIVNGAVVKARPRNPDAVELYDGLHESLISENTFRKAQECLASNRPPSIKNRGELKSPLAGIVVCGKCGRKMVRRPYQSGRMPSLICYDPQCKNVSADFDLVEKRLLDSIAKWIEQYELEDHAQPAVSDKPDRAMLLKLNDELFELEKQRDSAYRLLERGIYSDEEFFERRASITAELERINSSRAALTTEIERKRRRNENASSFLPKWRHVLEAYDSATIQGKNEMLKEILEKVVYVRDASGRHTGIYDNFSLEIFPRWPEAE